MTAALSGHPLPWTEEEYLALGETPERIELLDGSLILTPSPTPPHQWISRRLANSLDQGAEARRFLVFEAVNIRLRTGRLPIPDVVVTSKSDFTDPVISADEAKLVIEILSPSNASMDKVLKMNLFATAGIPWYMIVDPASGVLHLYRLDGDHYVEESATKPGETLHLIEPVEAVIRPEELLLY
jgi:Uma2 family endonuclease